MTNDRAMLRNSKRNLRNLFLGLVVLSSLAHATPSSASPSLRRASFDLSRSYRIEDGVKYTDDIGWRLEAGRESGEARIPLRDLPPSATTCRLLLAGHGDGWVLELQRGRDGGREVVAPGEEFPVGDPARGNTLCLVARSAAATLASLDLEVTWTPRCVEGAEDLDAGPLPGRVEVAEPAVIARSEWGARAAREAYDLHRPEAVVVHHSWLPTQGSYYRTGGAESVAGIQRFHMDDDDRGWNDVGYHYLIGPDGNVFAGRPPEAVGAHAVPNTGKVGICVIGNYDPEGDPVTPESWRALEDLVTYLANRFDIPMTELYGHRSFSHKTCPGDEIYNRFVGLRREIHRRIGTMGID